MSSSIWRKAAREAICEFAAALPCAVCFSAQGRTRDAYLYTAALMIIVPAVILLTLAGILYRVQR